MMLQMVGDERRKKRAKAVIELEAIKDECCFRPEVSTGKCGCRRRENEDGPERDAGDEEYGEMVAGRR